MGMRSRRGFVNGTPMPADRRNFSADSAFICIEFAHLVFEDMRLIGLRGAWFTESICGR